MTVCNSSSWLEAHLCRACRSQQAPSHVLPACRKTTFIKNLFAAFAQDPELRVNDVPGQHGPTAKLLPSVKLTWGSCLQRPTSIAFLKLVWVHVFQSLRGQHSTWCAVHPLSWLPHASVKPNRQGPLQTRCQCAGALPRPTCGRLGALQCCKLLSQSVTSGLLSAGPTSKDIFAKDPDRLLTEILVRDEATMTSYHYRVQDTPGRLLYCRHRPLLCGASHKLVTADEPCLHGRDCSQMHGCMCSSHVLLRLPLTLQEVVLLQATTIWR